MHPSDILTSLQVLFAAATGFLYLKALRTSRSHRSRHHTFAAVAAAALALALVLALLAAALRTLELPYFGDVSDFDAWLLFGPLGITTALAALVLWRSMRAPSRRLRL